MLKQKLFLPLAFLLFCLLLFSSDSSQKNLFQERENWIFKKLNEAVGGIESVRYSAEYRIKFLANNDTLSAQGDCWFRRNDLDSLLDFDALIQAEDGKEYLYGPQGIFRVDHNEKSVFIGNAMTNGINLIKGNINGSLIFYPLLKGVNWTKLLEQDSVAIQLLEAEESGAYWVVEFAFPDEDEVVDNVMKLWVSKATYLPIRQTSVLTWEGMTQYKETIISNVEINIDTIDWVLENYVAPDSYTITYPKSDLGPELKALENGSIAPTFVLPGLDQDTIRLGDYKGKVVLLDFWYMSCRPCIKALPHLDELSQTYKDRGVEVIGIDSPDNPKRLEQLSDFVLKKGITYPTAVGDFAVDSLYNVRLYPTLYLINQKGEIAYSQFGFSESMLDTLVGKIEVLLEE